MRTKCNPLMAKARWPLTLLRRFGKPSVREPAKLEWKFRLPYMRPSGNIQK